MWNEAEAYARIVDRLLAVRHRYLQRLAERRARQCFLPVAAYAVEVDQLRQRRKEGATVAALRPRAAGKVKERQPAVVMLHADRRLRDRLWRVGGGARPFDVASNGARREQPVVAGAEYARLEANLHAQFQFCPGDGAGRHDDFADVGGHVPAANFGIGGKVAVRHRLAAGVDGEDIALDLDELDEQAGLATLFTRVVGQFDPLVGRQPQHRVAPRAADGELVGVEVVLPRPADDDRRVLARPLDPDARRRHDAMHLDAIELILQPAEARFGRHDTRALARIVRFGLRFEQPAAGRRQRIPCRALRRTVEGDARIAHAQQLNLRHHLRARRRVRPAQRHLADRRILQRGDVALPHVEIGEIGAGGQRSVRRQPGDLRQCRHRQVRLRRDRGRRLLLRQDAVHVVAAFGHAERGAIGGHVEAGQRIARRVDALRATAQPDHILPRRAHVVLRDGNLFVPVGVQRHAPLLVQDAAVMFAAVEGQPGKIALHSKSLLLKWD